MRDLVIKKILEEKLIVIVRGMEEEKILPLAQALYDGGIRMMEVTFNLRDPDGYSSTANAINSISTHFGNDMLIGAGTVVSPELVKIAGDAGALYIISPNTDTDVIRATKERGLVSMPGAMTPGECLTAHNAGADFIKLFPASDLGAAYLKALRAPLSHLKFLAVGGINDENIPEFIKAGAVGFGVGGNLVNKAWIEAMELERITALAKQYIKVIENEN